MAENGAAQEAAAGTEVAQEGAAEVQEEAPQFAVNADGTLVDLSGEDAPAEEGQEEAAEGDPAKPPPEEDLSAAERAAQSAKAAARQAKARRQREAKEKRELEQLRAERQRASQEAQLLQQDPVAFLRAKGFTDRQIAEHMARHAGPEDAMEVLRSENRALKERLDNWENQQKQTAQERAKQVTIESIEQEAANEEACPLLSTQPREVVHTFVRKAVHHLFANGEDADDYEHSELVKIAEKIYANSLRKKPAPAAQQQEGGTQQAAQQNGNGRKAVKPLTNDKTSRKFSKPANFDSLPLDEQEKILDQIYSPANMMALDGEG